MSIDLPTPRGALTPDRPLDGLTWLRVGGPADWLFQPADAQDLAAFLKDLDPAMPVFPIGVGSTSSCATAAFAVSWCGWGAASTPLILLMKP